MKDLSRRQQAILDFIGNFLDENDYPPTIRDIQAELGISSTSVVDYNLKVLESHNLIRRNRNISRNGGSNSRHSICGKPIDRSLRSPKTWGTNPKRHSVARSNASLVYRRALLALSKSRKQGRAPQVLS